jgi:hypothetical protein
MDIKIKMVVLESCLRSTIFLISKGRQARTVRQDAATIIAIEVVITRPWIDPPIGGDLSAGRWQEDRLFSQPCSIHGEMFSCFSEEQS